MAERRGTKKRTRKFTLDQLSKDPLRVLGVAKKDGGCIVVDKDGQQLFGIYFPRPTLADW